MCVCARVPYYPPVQPSTLAHMHRASVLGAKEGGSGVLVAALVRHRSVSRGTRWLLVFLADSLFGGILHAGARR